MATTAPSTFPQFGNFPWELRNMIWLEAMPSNIDSSFLVAFRPGCWEPRLLQPGEDEYYPNRDDLNRILEFRYHLLGDLHVRFPLFLVNREANAAATAWATLRNLKIKLQRSDGSPVVARPFRPDRDALFVSLANIDEYPNESGERLSQPDAEGLSHSIYGYIQKIAIPSDLVALYPWLMELQMEYGCVTHFCCIPTDYLTGEPVGCRGDVSPHWCEFEVDTSREIRWNFDELCFESKTGDGGWSAEIELFGGLRMDGLRSLAEGFESDRVRRFTIQPIRVLVEHTAS